MLVPLETLPGWPVAPAVTPLDAIGLLIVLPAIAIAIITTIGLVGHKVAASRPREAWEEHAVGPTPSPETLGGSGAAAALPAEQSGDTEVVTRNASADADTAEGAEAAEAQNTGTQGAGGAGARW